MGNEWQLDMSEKVGKILANTENLKSGVDRLTKDLDDHKKSPYAHVAAKDHLLKTLVPVLALGISLASCYRSHQNNQLGRVQATGRSSAR